MLRGRGDACALDEPVSLPLSAAQDQESVCSFYAAPLTPVTVVSEEAGFHACVRAVHAVVVVVVWSGGRVEVVAHGGGSQVVMVVVAGGGWWWWWWWWW